MIDIFFAINHESLHNYNQLERLFYMRVWGYTLVGTRRDTRSCVSTLSTFVVPVRTWQLYKNQFFLEFIIKDHLAIHSKAIQSLDN